MTYLFRAILVIYTLVFFTACDNPPPTYTECTASNATISTDTNVVALKNAMIAFRQSLSSAQLNSVHTCLDNERLYKWHNTPGGADRGGLTYGDLSTDQLILFKTILQGFLSAAGYKKVNDITYLAEGFLSTMDSDLWNTNYYAIELFNDPEKNGSWGFQLDGHHCAINCLVHGDVVSMVPAFLAAEPVAETYQGTSFDIFASERDIALNLYSQLTTTELNAATQTGNRTMRVGPASSPHDPDPHRGNYDYSGFATGLKYSDMSAAAQAQLIDLMKTYVYNLKTPFADTWWADINTNINDTYFVWIDEVTAPSATTQFYYRIYNPYLWVEYNMENPVGNGIQNHNHIHTITRIPNNPTTSNGGDYGIFAHIVNKSGPSTIYEHYMTHDHHQHSSIKLDYTVEGIPPRKKHHHSHKHPHQHR